MKVISAQEAAALVKNGQTLVVGGSSGISVAESFLVKLEERFLETGEPRDLFAVTTSGLGDKDKRGINHVAHEGMIRRTLCAHYGLQPSIAKMARENKIEAYNFPQGVMSHIFGAIAAHKPGVLTDVGLGTYMDPRLEGGRMNERTTEEMVKLLTIEDREWLLYKSFPVDVAVLRGTTADEDGNITFEHEACSLESISTAQAAHNSGGIVIVEVKRLAKRGTLDPRRVVVPGILVDYVIVDPEPMMTWQTKFDPSFIGEVKKPVSQIAPLALNVRKVVARRAAMELRSGAVVNLGSGISAGIPNVAVEEGILDQVTVTIESGVIGGMAGQNLDFGTTTNPVAITAQPDMFNFYDGGGLDIAFLSFVEADEKGNINVTKLSGQIEGPGGFMDISANAKRMCFLGTFTAGGLDVSIGDGEMHILKEGRYKKFINEVSHLTWSADHAREIQQPVLYITERAVFELRQEGIMLTEIAPGVDLEKDVLSLIPFRPLIAENLKLMDARIFRDEPMGLGK